MADASGPISNAIAETRKSIDCYFDARTLPLLLRILVENKDKISILKIDQARLRCITEITRENMAECKELLNYFELYHTARLAGSFMIADQRIYLGFLTRNSDDEKLLRITNASFVDAQEFLMKTMVETSLPAIQRIREIGKGTEEFMETIRDPAKIKTIILELVKSTLYEIDILFSTKNSFLIAEREGILEEISKISRDGVKVKVLVMQDERVKEISDSKLKLSQLNIQVNYLQHLLPTKITTLILDQARTLTIEVNDDTKDTLEESSGLSIFSNSESTVFSNVSIFQSLWIQSEVDKQNNARQAYFQLFKGLKLKDEIYNRHWKTGNAGKRKNGTSADTVERTG
jgi:hypothetical protein